MTLLFGHFPIILHIALCCHKDHLYIWISWLSDLVNPTWYVLVADWVSYRIRKHDAMRTFIEWFCYISKAFLTSSIPYIERYLLPGMLDPLDFKINANSTQIVTMESILTVSNKQICFSNTTISNNYVFQGCSFRLRHCNI